MNFLTTILPGVRVLRNPLIVGVLWAVLGYLIVGPHWQDYLAARPSLQTAIDQTRQLPSAYLTGALVFVVYLFGSVMLFVSHGLIGIAGSWCRSAGSWVADWGLFPHRIVYRIRSAMSLDPPQVRSPVVDRVHGMYGGVGAPSGAAFAFPLDAALAQLEVAALQLWKAAPEQYQEIDRLRTEADLRSGMAIPTIAIGGVLASRLDGWIFVPVVLLCAILGYQGHQARRQSDTMIALAVYVGTVDLPVLKELSIHLKTFGLNRSDSEGAWMAATIISLERMGDFESAQEVLNWLGNMLMEHPDPARSREAVDLLGMLDEAGSEMAEFARKQLASFPTTPSAPTAASGHPA